MRLANRFAGSAGAGEEDEEEEDENASGARRGSKAPCGSPNSTVVKTTNSS